MAAGPPRRALSFFYITYETGDLLGYVCAWSSVIPAFYVSFLTLSLINLLLSPGLLSDRVSPWPWPETRRSLSKFLGAQILGCVGNEVLARVLKSILRHPRPLDSDRVEFGMPSSHAQFVAFVLVYTVVLTAHLPKTLSLLGVWVGWAGVTALVSFARVYLGYHYASQVAVGWLLGGAVAAVWVRIVRMILRE